MIKKNALCEKIVDIKTSILIIEQNRVIAEKLSHFLDMKDIKVHLKSRNFNSKYKIKPYDIYIINIEEYTQTEKYEIIKNILSNNSQANIFLLNESVEEKNYINKEYGFLAHAFKCGQAVSDVPTCDEKGLETILETIESVETTKKKIHELWNKLEKVI